MGARVTARTALERAFDGGLAHSPVQAWFRHRAARRLVVLAYHGVDDEERFALHLDWLVRHTHPLSLDEAIDTAYGRRPPAAHSVLVTFDDGRRSILDVALPLLRDRGVPAVAFVVAGLIGTDEPFWWDEVVALWEAGGRLPGGPTSDARAVVRWLKSVPDDDRRGALLELRQRAGSPSLVAPQLRPEELRELESHGVAIGNHTLTHPCLPRCTDERIGSEIRDAHALLTAWLGHEPRSFAYPNGDIDARAEAAVASAGYELAFLFDHRLADVPARHPLRTSRVRVDSDTTFDRFRTIMSGAHPAVHHLRGRA